MALHSNAELLLPSAQPATSDPVSRLIELSRRKSVRENLAWSQSSLSDHWQGQNIPHHLGVEKDSRTKLGQGMKALHISQRIKGLDMASLLCVKWGSQHCQGASVW